MFLVHDLNYKFAILYYTDIEILYRIGVLLETFFVDFPINISVGMIKIIEKVYCLQGNLFSVHFNICRLH